MLDWDFITPRVAVGGAIYSRQSLDELKRAGVTHIINTQIEFDDRSLLDAGEESPEIVWLATDDDFLPKPPELFFEGMRFALEALERPGTKLLIHCASGIHRGPMVALALLRVLGYSREEAVELIQQRRPEADFPAVYLESVEAFLATWQEGSGAYKKCQRPT